jgi:hypothetical protein
VRNAYPDVNQPPSIPQLYNYLQLAIRSDNPLEEQSGVAAFRWYGNKPGASLKAGLIQVCGSLAPTPCRQCERGAGRWKACVVSADHSPRDAMSVACACCFYSSQGQYCSFRADFATAAASTPGMIHPQNPVVLELTV